MKKFIAIILAVLCVFALCACGNDGGSGDNDADKTAEYTPDYGELYYASGEADSTFESNSCAYQGKDKFYYYDGFEILVNDVDGTERITGITIADDTVSNPQGVKIGMKIDEALALMDGIEYVQSGDTYKFTVGSTLFRLQAGDDGTVAAAEYSVAANDK